MPPSSQRFKKNICCNLILSCDPSHHHQDPLQRQQHPQCRPGASYCLMTSWLLETTLLNKINAQSIVGLHVPPSACINHRPILLLLNLVWGKRRKVLSTLFLIHELTRGPWLASLVLIDKEQSLCLPSHPKASFALKYPHKHFHLEPTKEMFSYLQWPWTLWADFLLTSRFLYRILKMGNVIPLHYEVSTFIFFNDNNNSGLKYENRVLWVSRLKQHFMKIFICICFFF